eukprot:TRINITY_DN3289_c0_g1_i4.p2 TRINITY_DN3289_c0_g1~~TRINITY_DN3289_c0_g1_i4.p2  ORF type:complete len:347 (+),score=69.14 TRINITY_DN3289_c0_g1_i4:1294-2334(+)
MNCCPRESIDPVGDRIDEKISEAIEKDESKKKDYIKLLLLGTGESGKSTIAKQLRLIHNVGYTPKERESIREVIHNNVYESMKTLYNICRAHNFKVKCDVDPQFFENQVIDKLTKSMADTIEELWKDDAIQKAFSLKNEFTLEDGTEHLLSKVQRLVEDDYVPTDEDIVRARVKTTGVYETTFDHDGSKYILIDVGGQRSERKKWIHCFEGVTTILFCVALSEFDLFLYEDSTVNRMNESLKLFHEVCRSKWFANVTNIFLFLNKSDLFKEKIQSGAKITKVFPQYEGDHSYDSCIKYIKEQFSNVVDPLTKQKKKIITYVTCATDTENIKDVFEKVTEGVLQDEL